MLAMSLLTVLAVLAIFASAEQRMLAGDRVADSAKHGLGLAHHGLGTDSEEAHRPSLRRVRSVDTRAPCTVKGCGKYVRGDSSVSRAVSLLPREDGLDFEARRVRREQLVNLAVPEEVGVR